MDGQISPKIIGATVIGFALVAGAYVISNFGESNYVPTPQTATVQTSNTPKRVAIEVADTDGDGIEDWQDTFVTNDTVVVVENTLPYATPETLSGQTSIQLLENILSSKVYGPLGNSEGEIVEQTVDSLVAQTSIALYGKEQIDVLEEWDDEDIVNYANTVAATIYRHNNPDLEHEMSILLAVTKEGASERIDEIRQIRDIYGAYRDDTLQIPVPSLLAKEHLDLINTYQAIYEDLDAMVQVEEDPLLTLIHINRYQDDALGLYLAMQNMYETLEPHAALFTVDDPAVLFVVFSEDYQP